MSITTWNFLNTFSTIILYCILYIQIYYAAYFMKNIIKILVRIAALFYIFTNPFIYYLA